MYFVSLLQQNCILDRYSLAVYKHLEGCCMRIKYNYGYSNMYSQDIKVESEVVGAMSKPTSICTAWRYCILYCSLNAIVDIN